MTGLRFSVLVWALGLGFLTTAAEARDLRLPAGTVIPIRLQTTHSSANSRLEERVLATVRQNVYVGGEVAIPAGSELRGHVVSARRPGRVKGQGYLAMDFDRLVVRGRTHEVGVRRLALLAPRSRGRDAKMIGGGTGAGAVIGAIADGKKGAVKGALIGGATGTGVVLSTRGKEAQMPAGSRWRVRLSQALVVER
jgi:hypothetical protein